MKWWVSVLLIAGALALVVILIWFGYAFDWDWTGLGSSPKSNIIQPAKNAWDWLQLLIVPAALAGAAFWFNAQQSKTEQQISVEQRKLEREIVQDQQRENALQAYLDHMAELLLKEHLRVSQEGDEVRQIARVRTLTVLRTLDARRNAMVLRFLQEAGLREQEQPIVDLRESALGEVAFQGANLAFLNLSGLDLSEANLSRAILSEANLSRAILSEANLSEADLNGADLMMADMHESTLIQASLIYANLSGALLIQANLTEGDLRGAILSEANLSEAKMTNTSLNGADLSKADLTKAIITDEQLKAVKSLEGATMPDGRKYT